MMPRMRKAFAYLRVSGRGQIDGDGFPRQEQAIRRYATANGIEIVTVYREEGVSGTKDLDNRDALQQMLLAVEQGDVDLVLIERLDRLARDLMIQETIIRDFRSRHIELVSVAEPDLCNDDPSRKMMRQIFGAIAEYDRAMIVLKLRGARQRMKLKAGRCEGRKPYGSREGEHTVILRMHTMRTSGLPWTAIAERLNADGVASRAGRWHANSVRRTVLATAGDMLAPQRGTHGEGS
jgi:DNA invertase Pin-like site-specific DNA recombinase